MEFALGDLRLTPADDSCARLEAAGLPSLAPRAGLPALPQASRLLALPRGSRVWVAECSTTDSLFDLAAVGYAWLQPFEGARVKDMEPMAVERDKEVYTSPQPYRNGAPLEVEALGVMGDQQIFRLTVHLVTYHPAERTLLVTTHVRASLRVELGASTANADSQREGFLIVSRPAFRQGLQPFVTWKRQEGYAVEELYVETHLRDSVKARIANYFPSQQPERWPRYLLLVGDAAQLQAYLGTVSVPGLSGYITDLYYAEHTGDYLPDALVGRWPVNDTAELGTVVRKTLAYEQFRGIDTLQLRRLLLVAGAEDSLVAPITTNGQVAYLSHEAKQAHPTLDTLVYHNPASANQRPDILQDLGHGVAMVNYTAHCTVGGWSSPSVGFQSIDTLGMSQPTMFVNNCCLSNAFGGTCFGEQLLRTPAGGAIGVVGATNSTLWNEDYYWAVGPKYPFSLSPVYDPTRLGAFDWWTGREGQPLSQGELLVAGNLAVTAFGSPYDKFYWETYCLLGDPSLRPWVGVPQEAVCTLAEMPRVGNSEVRMVCDAGLRVSVMQADSLLGTALTDGSDTLRIALNSSIDSDQLTITCSDYPTLGQGSQRPFQWRPTTLEVQPAAPAKEVGFYHVALTDSTVQFTLKSLTTDTLRDIQLTLTQDSLALQRGARLAAQPLVVDTLLPGETKILTLSYAIVAEGATPYWQALLQAAAGTELGSLTLNHNYMPYHPEARFVLLETDGTAAQQVEAHHNYRLQRTVEGPFDSLDLRLSALPYDEVLLEDGQTAESPLFSTPDTLTHLHIEASLHNGGYRRDYSHYLVAGHRMDCFEEGLASYPWQGGGTRPWRVDSTVSHSGRYCLRSGAIDYRQTSDLLLHLYLPQPDSISFWARTSCEVKYDKLQFMVDGAVRGMELWGESGWIRLSYRLPAGEHTLRWRYVKDEGTSEGSDCAWIDDVRLPLALWDSAYGWFGDPTTLGLEPAQTLTQETTSLYPNPADGKVDLVADGAVHCRVVDVMGREWFTAAFRDRLTIDVAGWPDGIYFVTVRGNGLSVNKLIVRHAQ